MSNDFLEHYGVLGMKWGVRKDPVKTYNKAGKRFKKLSAKVTKYGKQYNKTRNNAYYVATKRAEQKRAKFYEEMYQTFSTVKFSDLQKSKLNQEYVAQGNDYIHLNSMFKGVPTTKFVIPDMKDVGFDSGVAKKKRN